MKTIFKGAVIVFILSVVGLLSSLCNLFVSMIGYITSTYIKIEDLIIYSLSFCFVSGAVIYHTINYKKSHKTKITVKK